VLTKIVRNLLIPVANEANENLLFSPCLESQCINQRLDVSP
jgi:hypothetical protein